MSDAFDLDSFLKNLPNLPGVYRMIDKNGQVLYVGKAVNLKNRVKSYFAKNDHSPRITLMIRQIARIETTVTRSEAEALILENNLIKSLAPKYNILFRDDKSYPYLKLSAHDFPQMSYYRGHLKPPHRYFGPFPSSQAVRDSIDVLQKVFQLRTCEDSVFAHRDRACLLHQIRRCSAPCVGMIKQDTYQQDLIQATDFLDGKTDELMRRIGTDMNTAAEKLDFEQAALLRDRLQALTAVQARQFIDSNHSDTRKNIDVIAVVAAHGLICIHLVSIRAARRILDNSFFPKNNTEDAAQEAAEAFVAQRYLGKAKPDVLIGNFKLPETLHQTLNDEAGRKIAFVSRPQRERKVWLEMARQNALLAIEQRARQSDNQHKRQQALAEIMGLPSINRIECFDISHTFGEATIASCVVYDDDAMQNAQYRRFNIRTATAGDDYAAMREALTRRYTKLASADADAPPRPDVVVIDGGKGQITVALEVWADLGLDIPLIGVAKGPERRAGEEDLILPASGEVLQLPPQHPALHLLQTVRDEAHRFAITGHRKKRAAARNRSQLDDIPGIGAKRRRELIARFGSVRGIQAAALEDLAQVPGISGALAEKIYRHFHD